MDILNDIKDRSLDLLDGIRDKIEDIGERLGFDMSGFELEPQAIISGIAIIIGLISILKSIGSFCGLTTLKNYVAEQNRGRQTLETSLSASEEPDFSEKSKDIFGREEIVLQYSDISCIEEYDSFTQLSTMINIDINSLNKYNNEYDDNMFQEVNSYIGLHETAYGGAMIIPAGYNSGLYIRMIAYQSENQFEKDEDDMISNVTVEIAETTVGSGYGNAKTKKKTTILKGYDVRGFSTIEKGSIMYARFGESQGGKIDTKYICTGIEPGTYDTYTVTDEETGETTTKINVYSSSGQDIKLNETDGLIFYQINSQTGAVIITYWNTEDSKAAQDVLADYEADRALYSDDAYSPDATGTTSNDNTSSTSTTTSSSESTTNSETACDGTYDDEYEAEDPGDTVPTYDDTTTGSSE
ncbi:hypothetical protein [Butyrivibrio fibrisolvens]|uniref:hypothetical protein n=1 Tax=Butyrivibrio fibrisolvens TaxID=831 RepID=UPI0003B74F4C|nr:hypothetical protein [Butyrivibrio fibrisolvens]